MSAVDLIAAAYIAFGIWRGRMRGLADEGYRLIRMLLAFVAGCGLYGFISALLKKLFSMTGGISAPLAFIIALGGAWWLTRTLKKTLATLLAARFCKIFESRWNDCRWRAIISSRLEHCWAVSFGERCLGA
ncbi:MAG: CvpA family protein [Kiritimatiellae bacterium]|nr:CvpA family protein [Kiritimatiellia bacterium]